MSEIRRKRTRTLRVLARFAIGSGPTSHRARAVMLTAAMGASAMGAAAPAARDVQPQAAVKPVAQKHHWFQIGKATWYGGDFNGRTTANGETFDENQLTAAHRTLPLGSWIRVTNLQNHHSAVVRVTDRGPWVNNAVLDLSHAAAHKLGFDGTAKVRIERVDPATPDPLPELTDPLLAQLEMPQRMIVPPAR